MVDGILKPSTLSTPYVPFTQIEEEEIPEEAVQQDNPFSGLISSQRKAGQMSTNPSDTVSTQIPSDDDNRATPEELAANYMRYANGLGDFAQMLRNVGAKKRMNAVKDYTPKTISAEPIGNYLTYKPTDTLYTSNLLGQQAGATRRAIQASGLSQGATAAALLAADNNYLNQLGAAYKQAEEANFARKAQIEEFNRGTNMYNSRSQMEADMANQRADLYGAQLNQQAEQMKEERRREYMDNYAQSISDFMNTISNIGREDLNRIMAYDYGDTATVNPRRMADERRAKYWSTHKTKK